MIDSYEPFYYHSITSGNDICNQEFDSGGRFMVDLIKKFEIGRLVARRGEWSIPWQQEIYSRFVMPEYNPGFNKTFNQVTNERAVEFKHRVNAGEKFAVMYSGGIDSTVIVSALLKNLTDEELTSIVLCMNLESILENPTFWKNHIKSKFKILDSTYTKYDTLIENQLTPIAADAGDAIFGTVMAIDLYNRYDYYLQGLSTSVHTNLQNLKYQVSSSEVHYSVFKDLIIKHLGMTTSPKFGRLLYEKYVHNINTSGFPVHSLHDFFWWGMFSIKYINCTMRGATGLNDRTDFKTAIDTIEDWFNTVDYQCWSMVNNNNGQKIQKTELSYKNAAKEYIWDLDKNDWYKNLKIKLNSGGAIFSNQRLPEKNPWGRVFLTTDFKMLYDDDAGVKEFIVDRFEKFRIDWTDENY